MQTETLPLADINRVLHYIDGYWDKIIKHNPEDCETLIGLPHRYLVPSHGAMFQEMYYWDSFFMALGVIDTVHEELIVEMTGNLAYLYNRFKVIPNASRYYFLSRSQPPFFTQMIWLAFDVLVKRQDPKARDFLETMIQLAESEHDHVWHGTEQPHHRLMEYGLSRYFDINFIDILASCESGWDHSTRCDDRWLEHLPVDLNAVLYVRETDFVKAWKMLGDTSRARYWSDRAAMRAASINEHLWHEDAGFYFDFDLATQSWNPTASCAGFYPLWAGLATASQAERIISHWLPTFEHEGGLVTTLEQRKGRQWAFPNGWAPLQWLVAEGLDRYGFAVEANRIRHKWLRTCTEIFDRTGEMWEKYNVVTPAVVPEGGLYGSISGFGWSNAVFVDFARKISKN